MRLLAMVPAILLLAWISLTYIRFRMPGGFLPAMMKGFVMATAPAIALLGVGGVLLSLVGRSSVLAALYGLTALSAALPVLRVMSTRGALSDGAEAEGPASAHQLQSRWGFRLPRVPEPHCERDVPFWTPPGSARPLLCDLWQPPAGIQPTGTAFIYFHGSAWVMLDKDYNTRPLFRQLAAQGHLVMDVAYRLYPETDLTGMVGDVRRAIAWMKAHGADYGVDPHRIVVGGGSAGGHLSLLAAYTEGNPQLTPADLQSHDTSVAGVVSLYGPVDLTACFYHLRLDRMTLTREEPGWDVAPAKPRGEARLGLHKMKGAGRLDWLLRGTPGQAGSRYAFFSPITHVHRGCPPTLLIQGAHDLISPAKAAAEMTERLQAAGVRVANLVLPQVDHAFDLMLGDYSPSTRTAVWHIERFLTTVGR